MTLGRVAKRYGRTAPWVVSDVDLELAPGTVTVLAGSNGSGKTTLLRMIAGVTAPTAGVVRGRPRRVAMVPDRFTAPVGMTARAYLIHLARIRGLSTAAAGSRAVELAQQLGLVPGLDVDVQDLSRGNAQKIALAQAFLAPVDLLVLDEPGTALDAHGASVLDGLVAGAQDAGAAVVISDPTPGASHPGARHHRLVGGRLQPVDRPASGIDEWVTVRLRARGAADGPIASAALEAMARRVSADELSLTLVVDPDRSDELLRQALVDGWSVLEVRRERPPGPA